MRTLPADLRLYYLQRSPPTIEGMQQAPQTYFPSLEQLFPSLMDKSTGNPTLAAKELVTTVGPTSSIVEDLHT